MLHPDAAKLRFDVYCNECGYLNPAEYPEGFETDEYDHDATHIDGCRDVNGELIGYARLIRQNAFGFPLLEHCPLHLGVRLPPAHESAEVSRLIVRKELRGSRRFVLTIFRELYRASLKLGIRHWYAAIDPRLQQQLAGLGFTFREIGSPADYLGRVIPYTADLREKELEMQGARPQLYAWFSEAPPLTGSQPCC